MTIKINIRAMKESEYQMLGSFLYDAIFIPEGQEKPSKEIIHLPELKVYFEDFGKETDVCLVAEYQEALIGAIWTRHFSETAKGFGYIDSNIPELSMSVNEAYRNQGIGTQLLEAMIGILQKKGYESVSLSVDVLNYAFRMYQKFGFVVKEAVGESVTMIKMLKKPIKL